MARLASKQKAGFYPFPQELIAPLSNHISLLPNSVAMGDQTVSLVDVCAGTGEPIIELGESLTSGVLANGKPVLPYLAFCELDAERCEKIREHTVNHISKYDVFEGDSFSLTWENEIASLLFLNPPYDYDKTYKRSENRWLQRFTTLLEPGFGLLVFVIPVQAIVACSRYLSEHYSNLHCLKFPPSHFDQFKQVVILGKRKSEPEYIPSIEDSLNDLSSTLESMLILGDTSVHYSITSRKRISIKQHSLDIIEETHDWEPLSKKLTNNIFSENSSHKFQLLEPLRPAHLVDVLAQGSLFNGEVLQSDYDLPDLIVCASQGKRFVKIGEKTKRVGDDVVIEHIMSEQPYLRITALCPSQGVMFDVNNDTNVNKNLTSKKIRKMNMADLMHYYQSSMKRLVSDHCEVLFDRKNPDHRIPMPVLERPLWVRQLDSAEAIVLQLMITKCVQFTGEVGVGKTSIVIAVATALSHIHFDQVHKSVTNRGFEPKITKPVQNVLVQQPPHLLSTWEQELSIVMPTADVIRINSISDANPLEHEPKNPLKQRYFLLSKEKSKLGYGYTDGLVKSFVGELCPQCGRMVEGSESIVARRKSSGTCKHYPSVPLNTWATLATLAYPNIAQQIPYSDQAISDIGRLELPNVVRKQVEKNRENRRGIGRKELSGLIFPEDIELKNHFINRWMQCIFDDLYTPEHERIQHIIELMGYITNAIPVTHPCRSLFIADWITKVNERIYQDFSKTIDKVYHRFSKNKDLNKLQSLFAQTMEWAMQIYDDVDDLLLPHNHQWRIGETCLWETVSERVEWLRSGGEILNEKPSGDWFVEPEQIVLVKNGGGFKDELCYGNPKNEEVENYGALPFGHPYALINAYKMIIKKAKFADGEICGGYLYSASPKPRRHDLAQLIMRRYGEKIDLIIADESHEYNNQGSAQAIALNRLLQRGSAQIRMTGTVFNGKASNLFSMLWSFSPEFKKMYGRKDRARFVRDYGFLKIKVNDDDIPDYLVDRVEYGATTDREIRKLGSSTSESHGVLPSLLTDHLLPYTVTLSTSDLDENVAQCNHIPVPITGDSEALGLLRYNENELVSSTISQLKRDCFTEKSNVLRGALYQLGWYKDLAHIGKFPQKKTHDHYVVSYPERFGYAHVKSVATLPSDLISPKEAKVFELLQTELSQGYNVIITAYHQSVVDRLEKLVRGSGFLSPKNVSVLRAHKVSTDVRKDWIDHQISQGAQVLITNMATIQTGLNNLVHFNAMICTENHNCSATITQQAIGRVARPGQRREQVPFYFLYYSDYSESNPTPNSMQDNHKQIISSAMSVSNRVNGTDITSSLLMNGAGDGEIQSILATSPEYAFFQMLKRQGFNL